jgi:phosphoribosylaminoimidazole-succinocarboxamide synthase
MSLKKLVHQGSTKDVYQVGDNYLFKFSDRYSVFDWGEMPDHLTGKGIALARFTKAIYKELEKKGIRHHLLNEACAQDEMIVQPFEVVRDGRSLKGMKNIFIPLEVIFRMGVARGSSLSKRMKDLNDWHQAGFSRSYEELEMFEKPMIEFTTKLERFDRPLSHSEAQEISGMNSQEWNSLLSMTIVVAQTLKEVFEKHDITLWDGKIELALNESREIVLVDSIGPDELRLTKSSVQLSKEIIRQYYRQTDWFSDLDTVKEKHKISFKDFISPPPPLPKEFKGNVEELYQILPELIEEPLEVNHKLTRLISKLRSSL